MVTDGQGIGGCLGSCTHKKVVTVVGEGDSSHNNPDVTPPDQILVEADVHDVPHRKKSLSPKIITFGPVLPVRKRLPFAGDEIEVSSKRRRVMRYSSGK